MPESCARPWSGESDDIERSVLQVARMSFEALAPDVGLDANMSDDLAAEYLDKIRFRFDLEAEFGRLIADDQILGAKTLRDVVGVIRELTDDGGYAGRPVPPHGSGP